MGWEHPGAVPVHHENPVRLQEKIAVPRRTIDRADVLLSTTSKPTGRKSAWNMPAFIANDSPLP